MRSRPTLAVAALCLVAPLGCQRQAPAPPVLGGLPAFALTDQTGRAFGSSDLVGQPYVVSFFFTSCVTICPKIMGAMQDLDRRLASKGISPQLLSITVDPVTDTPERLATHAQKLGADARRWHFLTGSEAELRRVVVEGFKTYMGDREGLGDDLFDIGHGARLVLVDGQGRVRGHFEPDPAGVDALARALERVVDN